MELTEPLEILYNRDEYSQEEWDSMEERKQLLEQY